MIPCSDIACSTELYKVQFLVHFKSYKLSIVAAIAVILQYLYWVYGILILDPFQTQVNASDKFIHARKH